MTRKHAPKLIAAATGLALSFAITAEDGLPLVAVDCGTGCARTIEGLGLMQAQPGTTFVITILHLPPAPEEAMDNGQPINCSPVRVRVDTLTANAGAQTLDLELGERNELEAGKSVRIVHTIPGQVGPVPEILPRIGFNVRADQASSPCSLVSSALMFDDMAPTAAPMSVALLSNALPQLVFESGFENLQ